MPPPQQGPNIMMAPEEFAGRWANMVSVQRTPHEWTLDFFRMGPGWQNGVLVARISCSALLASQLLELLKGQWQAYTEEAGIPPEQDAPDDD
jgi:hypothetical protein